MESIDTVADRSLLVERKPLTDDVPLAAAQLPPDDDAVVAPALAQPGAGSRVLIVDDEASVADLIEAVLVGEGYTVAIARDGVQGLLLARDWRPDLILMDVMLPGVDGTTAIRRLKADDETAHVPIVAMSAGRTIRRQSNELTDADAALAKPFDIEALLAQIEFLLSRRRVDG